jgi:hypothetical protein
MEQSNAFHVSGTNGARTHTKRKRRTSYVVAQFSTDELRVFVSLRYLFVALGFRSSSDMELFLEDHGSMVLCEE